VVFGLQEPSQIGRFQSLLILSDQQQKTSMRKVVYLLAGFLCAGLVGLAYLKLSGPSGVPAAPPPSPNAAGGADNTLLVAAVLVSWVTAFLRMPGWLATLLGFGIVWVGLAVMCVTGFFVYLNYPNNTLADGAYTGFLGGIAMVASRAASVLKHMHREGGFFS
jgi:hypothetical protein